MSPARREHHSESILLLGRDHGEYGRFELALGRDGATACALSVGADRRSPSREFKGDPSVPNEDALLVIEEETLSLLAVCDAHFGHESSHVLLTRLHEVAHPIPPTSGALLDAIRTAAEPSTETACPSETTLLAAVFDRASGAGFGISFGDSTVMVVGCDAIPASLAAKNHDFVSPERPESMAADRAVEFGFLAHPGEAVVAFTDGIDECHYVHPETSIRPVHLRDTWNRVGRRPEPFVRQLTEMALAGVDGNPGGQDNIALIACTF